MSIYPQVISRPSEGLRETVLRKLYAKQLQDSATVTRSYSSFDEMPEPKLTPQEDQYLSPILKERRIILRKYMAALDAKYTCPFFDVHHLIDVVIEESENEVKREFVIFQSGTGPTNFCVLPFRDADRALLIDLWITGNERRLKSVEKKDAQNFVGLVVACKHRDKPEWFRGFMFNQKLSSGESQLYVKALEYGHEYLINVLEGIMMLPLELQNFTPFGIQAKLGNIQPNVYEPEFDAGTRRDFVEMLTETKGCQKNIEGLVGVFNEEEKKYNVSLWVNGTDVSATIKGLYLKRKDTPRVSISDRNPKAGVIKLFCLPKNSTPTFSEHDDMQVECSRIVVVTTATSPSDFFVKYVSDTDTAFDRNRMQEFYENENNAEKYKLRGGHPFLDRYYVWNSSLSCRWERCRVVELIYASRTCSIYVMNLNLYFENIKFQALYEIRPEFLTWGEYSIHCSLVDVEPPMGKVEWPSESTDAFRELTNEKLLHCVIWSRELSLMSCGNPENMLRLKVVLLEKYASTTINSQLCHLKLASLSEETHTNFNACATDNEMTNFLTEDEHEKRFKKLNTTGKVVRRKISPCPAWFMASSKPETKNPSFYQDWVDNQSHVEAFKRLPLTIRKEIGPYYRISNFLSPGCIYIQELSKMPLLYKMLTDLTTQLDASESPIYPYDILSEGDFVAVPVLDGQKLYHRAIVKNVVSFDDIQVLLIDVGTTVSTNGIEVRNLPLDFLKIPGLAYRVHMDAIPVKYKLETLYQYQQWPAKAIGIIRDFVSNKQSDLVNFHCHILSSTSPILNLEEYNQSVVYSHQDQCWKNGAPLRLREERNLNMMRTHPVLENLYSSAGVDIKYKNKNEDSTSKSFKVERLSSLLVANGFAMNEMDSSTNGSETVLQN